MDGPFIPGVRGNGETRTLSRPILAKDTMQPSAVIMGDDDMRVTILLGCLYGISSILPLSGCSPTSPESFTAVRLSSPLSHGEIVSDNDPCVVFLKPGESVVVDDAVVANGLSRFFPGISGTSGARFMPLWVNSPKMLNLIFVRKEKPSIAVYLTCNGYWGYDDREMAGDRPAKADIQQYLRALFTNVNVQKVTSTQPRE